MNQGYRSQSTTRDSKTGKVIEVGAVADDNSSLRATVTRDAVGNPLAVTVWVDGYLFANI